MKKAHKSVQSVLILIMAVCFLSLTACYWGPKRYFDYNVIWYCDDPFIEFVGDSHRGGKMILDGEEYNLRLSWANDGTDIMIYDTDQEEATPETLIWKADTKVKKGQLIFVVTIDTVSNYDGKTIVLNQRPIEDDM